MNVILAGFNLDHETIKELETSSGIFKGITPETVSAAYARISRDPHPVNDLREIARREVEKARRSNENIVFEMGHSSIAEHAVFNIDILAVSRLIVEEIEKFRLCSYTEKSQRYIKLEDDFVIPEEVRNAGMTGIYTGMIKEQNACYHRLHERLRKHVFKKHSELASDPKNHSMLDGWAKEDARYIVSLATESQLGMTINARNLELMIRRTAAHPLSEVREFAGRLYEATYKTAPSLIRYTEATDFETLTGKALKEMSLELQKRKPEEDSTASGSKKDGNVSLVHVTPDGDEKIAALLLHSSSNLSMEECLRILSVMSENEKSELIRTSLRHMESYDLPPREFEAAELIYEIVLSASCFAQMKRHRMTTIISQDYDPSLEVTVPCSILETGMEDLFMEVVEKTNDTYEALYKHAPQAAPYVLTNAHRKRITLKTNVRELYHIARLREDRHAQWDIRETAGGMVRLARTELPMVMMLACGKDSFSTLREKVIKQ